MKATRIALLAVLLAGVLAGTGRAATSVSAGIHVGSGGRTSVDIGFFYDDLARYGHWMQRPSYGWVWIPRVTATSWRPYQQGHWVWTDYGWTWISDEPFGWATYHYGRWYDDPDYGWEWIPGEDWGPAWVDWHASNDYVGWAPLPPSYDVYRPSGFNLGFDDYVFVPERFFLSARVVSYAAPYRDCERIYRQGRSFTSYRRFNGGFFNQGVPVDRIQRVVGRPVTRYQVADLAPNRRFAGARIARNRVEVFRPQVQRVKVAPPPSRPVARRAVVSAADARVLASRHVNRRQMEMKQQGRPERQIREHGRAAREVRPPVQKERQIRQERQVRPKERAVREMRPPVRQRGQVREVKPPVRQERQIRQERPIRQKERAVREVRPPARQRERQFHDQPQVRQKGRPAVREFRPPARQERQVREQSRPPREVRSPAREQRPQQMKQGGGRGQARAQQGNPQGRQKRGHGGPP